MDGFEFVELNDFALSKKISMCAPWFCQFILYAFDSLEG